MTPQIGTRARRNTSPLWVVTCLFGDLSHGRHMANYRVFRDALKVPLIAVELAFDGRTRLKWDDADVVVSLTSGDVMWQKERLLNVALTYLPDACRYVAWLDSDVLFGRENWPRATCRLLDEYPVAQLFERVLECPRDADPHSVTPATAEGVSRSFGWRWRHNRLFDGLRVRIRHADSTRLCRRYRMGSPARPAGHLRVLRRLHCRRRRPRNDRCYDRPL